MAEAEQSVLTGAVAPEAPAELEAAEVEPESPPDAAPESLLDEPAATESVADVVTEETPSAPDVAGAESEPTADVADVTVPAYRAEPQSANRWTDAKPAPSTVAVEALASIMWRGETLTAGASLKVPPQVADRLVRKCLAKRL